MTTMTKPVGSRVSLKKKTGLRGKFTHMWKQRWLYLMSLPGFAFLIIFKYVPMYGVVMAFEEFNFKLGIGASPWIGLLNFDQLFTSGKFATVFVNSFVLSITRFLITFPIPILLALMLNEMRIKFSQPCVPLSFTKVRCRLPCRQSCSPTARRTGSRRS